MLLLTGANLFDYYTEMREAPAKDSVASSSTQNSENSELLPAHDNELRKTYLQQM